MSAFEVRMANVHSKKHSSTAQRKSNVTDRRGPEAGPLVGYRDITYSSSTLKEHVLVDLLNIIAVLCD